MSDGANVIIQRIFQAYYSCFVVHLFRDGFKTQVVTIVTICDLLQMVATFRNEMYSTYKLLM